MVEGGSDAPPMEWRGGEWRKLQVGNVQKNALKTAVLHILFTEIDLPF